MPPLWPLRGPCPPLPPSEKGYGTPTAADSPVWGKSSPGGGVSSGVSTSSESLRIPPTPSDAAQRFKKVANATALLWRLLLVAERRFRRLNAPEQLAAVYDGRKFEDGKLVKEKALKVAA